MKKILLLSVGLMAVSGCATRRASTTNAAAGIAPQLSVERFLQSTNSRDFVGMSRIFGTTDGPIGDTGSSFGCFWKKIGSAFGGTSCPKWLDVERRLDTISDILRHEDYEIVSEQRVAGREDATTRIGVDMEFADSSASDVGFFVVMAGERWMIQCIELDKVTSGSHNGTCLVG